MPPPLNKMLAIGTINMNDQESIEILAKFGDAVQILDSVGPGAGRTNDLRAQRHLPLARASFPSAAVDRPVEGGHETFDVLDVDEMKEVLLDPNYISPDTINNVVEFMRRQGMNIAYDAIISCLG